MPSPDSTPEPCSRGRSVFAPFAVPHTFNPDLGAVEALFAVAGTITRIFGACILFSLWGGFSVWTWSNIPSHFWRMAAVAPLVLLFLAALGALMWSVTGIERRIARGLKSARRLPR